MHAGPKVGLADPCLTKRIRLGVLKHRLVAVAQVVSYNEPYKYEPTGISEQTKRNRTIYAKRIQLTPIVCTTTV